MSADSRRTLAPLARRDCRITGSTTLGAYRLLTALDAEGPGDPRPGQFYMLTASSGWGGGQDERPYLPRAFSWARRRLTGEGVELDFLLEDVGPGTHALDGLDVDDGLSLLGPLGIGFDPPRPPSRAVLVGGGVGAAPILCLAEELGEEANVILGFRDAAHAQAAALFDGPVLTTDDGSVGREALVTEPLTEVLDAGGQPTVYACGPPPMLEAVRALCAERSVPVQLALESGMACGYGACFGCVVPTRNGYVRLCLDGPVLDGADLETALVAEGHAG